MKSQIDTLKDFLISSELAQRWVDAGAKVTVLLALLLLAMFVLHRVFRMSAARRASVLLLGAIAVPVVAAISLTGGERAHVWWPLQEEASSPPSPLALSVATPETRSPDGWVRTLFSMAMEGLRSRPAKAAPIVEVEAASAAAPIRWDRWALGVWIGGMVLVILRLRIGIWRLNRRVCRAARKVEEGRLWLALERTAVEMGLRRLPELWLSNDSSLMPLTWGAIRHRVVLPAGAENWDSERLAIVLRHELGHVRRRDCLAGWAMHLLLAPVWFHPLAWIANRSASDLRERACDDLVAGKGGAEQYARELVAISRGHQALAGALAMAKPKRLESRIRALFCPKVGRGDAGKAFRGSALAAISALILPMCFVSACQTVDVEPPAATAPTAPSNIAADSLEHHMTEPVFRKGDQKVTMKIFEVPRILGDPPITDDEEYRQLLDTFQAKGHGEIPAATIAKMFRWKGTDIMTLPAFPAGRRQELFVGRNVPYLVDPDAEGGHEVLYEPVGVRAKALVTKRGDGKLSVDLELAISEAIGEEVTPGGNKKPVFSTLVTKLPHKTIANGAGIAVMVREEVKTVKDKVAFFGDLPLVGGLFREDVEYTIRRHLLVRFTVVDP